MPTTLRGPRPRGDTDAFPKRLFRAARKQEDARVRRSKTKTARTPTVARERLLRWREREARVRALDAERKAREAWGLGEQWTRLDTMKPFHPEDREALRENADRLREIVLKEGAMMGAREAGVPEAEVCRVAERAVSRDRSWRG